MLKHKSTKNLLAESMKTLAKHKSVEKITIQDIVQNCGLTKTTFYNHFHDKYDLAAWIYSTSAEKIMNQIDSNGYEWKDSLSDGINYFIDNKEFLKNLILHTSGQNSFINYVAQFNIKILSDYIKRSNNITDLSDDIKILLKMYCYGTVCFLCEILTKPTSTPIDELVKLFERALPEPLKKFLYKN